MEETTAGVATLIAPFVNVTILVAIIVWKTKAPIKEMISSRHKNIKTTLFEVAQRLKESQNKYDEYKAKLSALDIETRAIFDEMKQDAQVVRVKRLNSAQSLASQIVVDAKKNAQNMLEQFESDLRTETVNLMMEKIAKNLSQSLTPTEKASYVKSLSGSIAGRSI